MVDAFGVAVLDVVAVVVAVVVFVAGVVGDGVDVEDAEDGGDETCDGYDNDGHDDADADLFLPPLLPVFPGPSSLAPARLTPAQRHLKLRGGVPRRHPHSVLRSS